MQAEIEKALSTILKVPTAILGSGRTDTGVHASQQIAHFDTENSLDENDMIYKLNSFLSKEVSINSMHLVAETSHARFDAKKRTYFYHLNQTKSPFKTGVSYYFNKELDVALIMEACELIRSWQNFECFSKVHTEVNNFNCEIFDISWTHQGSNHLFSVCANRFLRGMIRAMVGTLLDVGMGKTSMTQFLEILKSTDRQKAGRAVPAHGLFLEKVEYSPEIYI